VFVVALGVVLPWVALGTSQTVTIQDFNFSPVGVTVNAGDSVTWRNTGGEGHTATSNNGAFDTGVLNPGASKTVVFGTVGAFDYHCAIHPYMHGTVTVLAAVATTPPPTVAPTPTLPPTTAPTPTPTQTLVPTPARTAAPTTTPTVTVAPASSAPAASAIPTALASAAPTAPSVAAASPAVTATTTPAPTAAPTGDAGPLPLVVGVVVVVGIAGVALYAMRRR
jgi:hypothetical protein